MMQVTVQVPVPQMSVLVVAMVVQKWGCRAMEVSMMLVAAKVTLEVLD